jgi:hypothetical protein
LSHATDLATCRSALQQINVQMGRDEKERPKRLSPDHAATLKQRFSLDDDALMELASPTYTKLDGAYLEQCLLFRDAVRAIEPGNIAGTTESTLRGRYLDRVRLAFAWTVRQVRLEEEPEVKRRIDPMLLPPGFTVRRGVGSPTERALVFLALLAQMEPADKIRGCLVYCPEKADGEPVLWACGVVLDGKEDVYLFDPRLGLPLPGKDGGVATLGEVTQDPKMLDALNVLPEVKYTPAGEVTKQAQLRYVVSLEALAPRMTHLQDQLLGPAVPVRLAPDLDSKTGLLATLKSAAEKGAHLSAPVIPWAEGKKNTAQGEKNLNGPELLRRFVTGAFPNLPDEGGGDRGQYLALSPETQQRFLMVPAPPLPFPRQGAWQLAAVPFEYFLPDFRDQNKFPRQVGLGQRVFAGFANPFVHAITDAGLPRDLILRGRYTQAAPGLIAEAEQLQTTLRAKQRLLEKGNAEQRAQEWIDKAIKLYAEEVTATQSGNTAAVSEARKRIEEHWREAEVVGTVLNSQVAIPRLPEVTYQLGLCKHEAAEAKQTRVDLSRALGLPINELDRKEAEEAWGNALRWWEQYNEQYGQSPAQSAVRRLRARALHCLGKQAAAVEKLEDLSPPMWPLDQVAALYLAKQK